MGVVDETAQHRLSPAMPAVYRAGVQEPVSSRFAADRKQHAMSELKLVERAVLLALMGAGGRLRESADLDTRFGIKVTRGHRETLVSLDLIRASPGPWTYTLTEAGWEWARAELSATKPPGLMGQGALYAVLKGLERYVSTSGLSLQDVFNAPPDCASARPGGGAPRRAPVQQTEDLADITPRAADPAVRVDQLYLDAAILPVDESLALALQDAPVLQRAIARLATGGDTDVAAAARNLDAAAKLVLQWVRRAAELRQIAPAQAQGEEVPFDAVLHETDDPLEEGDRVIVRKAPIRRGHGSASLVLARGKVTVV